VATPVRTNVCKRFKAVWNAVVNFLFVTILQRQSKQKDSWVKMKYLLLY